MVVSAFHLQRLIWPREDVFYGDTVRSQGTLSVEFTGVRGPPTPVTYDWRRVVHTGLRRRDPENPFVHCVYFNQRSILPWSDGHRSQGVPRSPEDGGCHPCSRRWTHIPGSSTETRRRAYRDPRGTTRRVSSQVQWRAPHPFLRGPVGEGRRHYIHHDVPTSEPYLSGSRRVRSEISCLCKNGSFGDPSSE